MIAKDANAPVQVATTKNTSGLKRTEKRLAAVSRLAIKASFQFLSLITANVGRKMMSLKDAGIAKKNILVRNEGFGKKKEKAQEMRMSEMSKPNTPVTYFDVILFWVSIATLFTAICGLYATCCAK